MGQIYTLLEVFQPNGSQIKIRIFTEWFHPYFMVINVWLCVSDAEPTVHDCGSDFRGSYLFFSGLFAVWACCKWPPRKPLPQKASARDPYIKDDWHQARSMFNMKPCFKCVQSSFTSTGHSGHQCPDWISVVSLSHCNKTSRFLCF